ncbi:MAG: molybdopterin molybdotransferase MoeA [Desulfobacterales bacterium]|nr:molybdopterin molybdotransferase MoeA [Desulfobacterales bacterium]
MKKSYKESKLQQPPAAPRDMLGRAEVIPLAAALARLKESLGRCPPVEAETVNLEQGLGRVLAGPIRADQDLPSHPRSTMDGYAVKASATFGATEAMPVYLTVSGAVRMGEIVARGPRNQECFQIATGGYLPPDTDAVIMLEHTVDIDGTLIEVTRAMSPGGNILGKGDDVRKGARLLEPGVVLRPQELGLLAGLGKTTILVHKEVRVGIFSTGDEIVTPDQTPPLGKIRDMNGINLNGLGRQAGARCRYYGIVRDREADFAALLEKALAENDLVLFSGSSSVGVRDLGEQIIDRIADPGIIVHGVAIKPGKPVIIGFAGQKPLFGLPGHPVSAAVAFDLFVRPAIAHLSGRKVSPLPDRPMVRARLQRNLNSAPGRTDFIRVRLEEIKETPGFAAHPVLGKSGALSTMVQADGFFIIKESSQGVYEGDLVEVYLY